MTDAARSLRISQPSVSRLITDFEASIHLKLFERRHGRISPTPEALRLYEEVERNFRSLDQLLRFARDIESLRGSQLTIAGMPALCLDLLPMAVAEFLDAHPQSRIAMQARSSQQIVDWIMTQQCELGLAGPPFDVRGVVGEMLVTTPCVCVVPVDHPLATLDRISPKDIGEEPVIHPSSLIVRNRLDRVFSEANLTMRSRIETPLSIVALRHVELGLGVAIVEPFTARYCTGRKLIVRPFVPTVPFVFGVLAPAGKPHSLAIREFLEILKSVLTKLDLPCQSEIAVAPFTPQP